MSTTKDAPPNPPRAPNRIVHFRKVESPLLAYRANVTSQCGEDGIIERIVEVIEPEHKVCVEFGAWDGKHFSNCYNLLENKGWKGVMIEANAEKFKELQATFATNERVTTVQRLVDFQGPNTLDNILDEVGVPDDLALVSIDIDGNDYYIFESLVKKRPEIVLIEFNPTVPNDVVFVQEKTFDVNQGCSLMALILLGKQKGYELAVCTEWNAIFVRKEKFPLLGITDNFISSLYRPVQDGRIFQGYDGTIHVVGMDRMVWQGGLPLVSDDFQVLPKSARIWGDAQR